MRRIEVITGAGGLRTTLTVDGSLLPENGRLEIELRGDLAMMLQAGRSGGSRNDDRSNRGSAGPVQVTLVAGVGFEPTTFRL